MVLPSMAFVTLQQFFGSFFLRCICQFFSISADFACSNRVGVLLSSVVRQLLHVEKASPKGG